jgi:hypothetical protein
VGNRGVSTSRRSRSLCRLCMMDPSTLRLRIGSASPLSRKARRNRCEGVHTAAPLRDVCGDRRATFGKRQLAHELVLAVRRKSHRRTRNNTARARAEANSIMTLTGRGLSRRRLASRGTWDANYPVGADISFAKVWAHPNPGWAVGGHRRWP